MKIGFRLLSFHHAHDTGKWLVISFRQLNTTLGSMLLSVALLTAYGGRHEENYE